METIKQGSGLHISIIHSLVQHTSNLRTIYQAALVEDRQIPAEQVGAGIFCDTEDYLWHSRNVKLLFSLLQEHLAGRSMHIILPDPCRPGGYLKWNASWITYRFKYIVPDYMYIQYHKDCLQFLDHLLMHLRYEAYGN